MTNYYGIDLGTTYSAIACVNESGTVEVLKNTNGEYLTPSVVYFQSPTDTLVGEDAVRNVPAKDAHRVASAGHIKRIMHKTDSASFFKCDGQERDPVFLSALIIKKLLEGARAEGHDVREVTITHPAYFDQLAIKRTKDAGVAAGLPEDKVHLIPEPLAAVMCYMRQDHVVAGQTVLVYNLGDEEFDVTVARISQDNRNVELVSIGGNLSLGGKNWSQRIAEFYAKNLGFQSDETEPRLWREEFVKYLSEQLESSVEYPLEVARDFVLRLSEDADDIKRSLTKYQTHDRRLCFGKFCDENVRLSRQQFDEMTSDLLNQTLASTESALKNAAQKGIG